MYTCFSCTRLHTAPVISADGIAVQILRLGRCKIRDNNHIRIPLIDLLHVDHGVGIIHLDFLRRVQGAHRVAPELSEKVSAGGDHLLIVILEKEENLLLFLLGDVFHRLLHLSVYFLLYLETFSLLLLFSGNI